VRERSPIRAVEGTPGPELRRRLFRAQQPIPRFELSFPSRAAQLFYALRCRMPLALKIILAELLGRLDRRHKPDDLAEARRATEAIVSGTHLQSRIEAIARRRLVEERVREAAFWRSRWDRDPVVGLEHMHAALAEGRGVIVSFCHLGSFQASIAPLHTEAGRTTYIATNSWMLDPPDGSEWGARIEHWRRGLSRADGRIVRMPGTFETLQALLERGELTMLAFDVPGRMDTHFLGKSVMLTAGAASLALQTDAIVLPLRRVRRGLRIAAEFGRPIDSRAHADQRSLHTALAAVHEAWILDQPAALEDPGRPGAWEHAARPVGWSRPTSPKAA
jgi:lauroyl/myristoyl acyltransferase